MIYTRKLKIGTHAAGQTAIHMEGRGLVALMEAGNQATRDYDAAEIVKRWNAHEDLVKIAGAYRNHLRTAAHTEGQVTTFEHIEDVLKTAGQQ